MIQPGETYIAHECQNHPVLGEARRLATDGFNLGRTIWNLLVGFDRQGASLAWEALLPKVNEALRCNFLSTEWLPFARRITREYLDRRMKAQGPLRLKSTSRMSSIPLEGPLASLPPEGALRARLRRCGSGYVLAVVQPVQRVQRSHTERLARVYHTSKIEEIGIAATPDGLDIVVSTLGRRKDRGGTTHTYRMAWANANKPGMLQELYRHMIAPRANTVALDVSMLPSISGPAKQTIKSLHRLLRARKAEGAIEYRTVSPVRREIQGDLKMLGGSLPRKTLDMLHRHKTLKCPHCGAPTDLRLDPSNLSPLCVKAKRCRSCGEGVSPGSLLAARASFQAHYALFRHQLRWEARPTAWSQTAGKRHR